MGRGDPMDAERERLRPFPPVSNRRCGRWRNHRQVIDGILHRVRTGVQWRDLPERLAHGRRCTNATVRGRPTERGTPAPAGPGRGRRG
ncbi:transposase [Streptomyces misionensis]|uniref:transposase n=1 Tax=Streptomyces misionensis TaxID=67331 RepID=UPI00367D8708